MIHQQNDPDNFVMCAGESYKAIRFAMTASHSIALNMNRRRSGVNNDVIAKEAETSSKAQHEILQASGFR